MTRKDLGPGGLVNVTVTDFGVTELAPTSRCSTWKKERPFKNDVLVGGFNPTPLKNMSQMGVWFPNIWKNKNVPNHQPEK